jgi:hypothetical protein
MINPLNLAVLSFLEYLRSIIIDLFVLSLRRRLMCQVLETMAVFFGNPDFGNFYLCEHLQYNIAEYLTIT